LGVSGIVIHGKDKSERSSTQRPATKGNNISAIQQIGRLKEEFWVCEEEFGAGTGWEEGGSVKLFGKGGGSQ